MSKKVTKELGMETIIMCQKNAEMYERNQRAREYSANVQRRRDKKLERIANIAGCMIAIIVGILLAYGLSKTDVKEKETYTMQGELQGNYVVLSDGNMHEVDETNANYTSEPMQVTVRLDSNGTEDVTDDIILDIR